MSDVEVYTNQTTDTVSDSCIMRCEVYRVHVCDEFDFVSDTYTLVTAAVYCTVETIKHRTSIGHVLMSHVPPHRPLAT